jgi:hypothetical protein
MFFMVNEAVLIFETEIPIPFTCSDSTGVEKGTILKLADPMTASASSATDDIIAGIAGAEKIANDGVTKIPVYRRGIFKVIASGSITAGDSLGSAGDGSQNYVYSNSPTANLSGSKCIGVALETASDEETFYMELNVQTTRGV